MSTATPLLFAFLLSACATRTESDHAHLPAAPRPILQPPSVVIPTPDTERFPEPQSDRPKSGHHRWSNEAGVEYEGGWSEGRFHGEGTLEEPNGNRYVGEWRSGKRSGTGKQYFADGSYHDGSWELNQPTGPGTRKTTYGWIISGLWNDGIVSNGLLELPSQQTYAGPLYNKQGSEVSDAFLGWLSDLAERGDRYAQALLADAYTNFKKPAPDHQKQVDYLQKSAEQGFAPAQYQLARAVTGKERVKWLREAADRHYPPAMLGLARLKHANGDLRAAKELVKEAATRGLTEARRILAWWLATDPAATEADGTAAEALIRNIAITSGGWQYLDTLAAAMARQADFAAAVEITDTAIADADNRGQAQEVLARLKAHRQQYADARPWSEERGNDQ